MIIIIIIIVNVLCLNVFKGTSTACYEERGNSDEKAKTQISEQRIKRILR